MEVNNIAYDFYKFFEATFQVEPFDDGMQGCLQCK